MGSLPQNARLGVTRTPCTTSTSEAASDNIKYANSVRTINKLQEFFEDISIAPSDRLFVNGKEITKREAPHIFRNV